MKRFLFLLVALFLSVSALAACSSESDKNGKTESTNGEVEKQPEKSEDTQGSSENKQDEDSEENKKNQEADTSSGDFKDQTNLKIGDAGQSESTVGKYEITINSIKMKDEIEGELPMFNHFFVTDITLKNIGEIPYDAKDIIDNLELTEDLEGSGSGDYSHYFKSIKAVTGTIEPGQTVNGEIVFDGRESNKYFIRTNSGLIAAGAVKNKTTWTFAKSEAQ